METIDKLRTLLTSSDIYEQLGLAQELSICCLLFNSDALAERNPNDYWSVAERLLEDYFQAEGLVGDQSPIRECAVFHGDYPPEDCLAIREQAGLFSLSNYFGYVYFATNDHDWKPFQKSRWQEYEIAKCCYGAFNGSFFLTALTVLAPKGYYLATGEFVAFEDIPENE